MPKNKLPSIRSCSRKENYPTKEAAEGAIKRYITERGITAYKCHLCGYWHIGKK